MQRNRRDAAAARHPVNCESVPLALPLGRETRRRPPMATHGLPAWPWTGSDAEALPTPERLLLDAARLWEAEARAGRPPIPALRLLLAAGDAPAALLPLDALLR